MDDPSNDAVVGRAGFFRIPNEFVDSGSLASIKSLGQLKVWTVLKRYEKDGVAWPSLGMIATKAGMSRGNVSRAIRALNGCGLIPKIASGRGRYGSSRYTLANSVPAQH